MPCYLLLLLFAILNIFPFVKLKTYGIMPSNMTCASIPLASLSSRSDDRYLQLKLFSSPHFFSNYSLSCGKFSL